VLDLGCGGGQNASILASRGAHVFAMDISPDLLDLAARRAELDGRTAAITTVCSTAHAIPLPGESVDLVFGSAILHHLDLDRTAQELYRVLKPGGRAVFKEPIRNSRTIAFLRRLIPYQGPGISPYERPLRLDEIERFAARFSFGRHREFQFPMVALARVARLPQRMVNRLRHWEGAVIDRWPATACLGGVMVFEITKK
jgi:SAM-dependent methyltransferase